MRNLPLKQSQRMIELKNKFESTLETTMEEFIELRELEFKNNKLDINFRLSGDNKYYYANQCAEFTKNLYSVSDEKTKLKISADGISFNPYSINIGYNQYCEDFKRFNSTDELLGFVVGFNKAMQYIK